MGFSENQKLKKQKYKNLLIAGLLILLAVLLIFVPLLVEEQYMLASILFMVCSFFPLMIKYEHKKVTSKELVLIAILGAIAAVSRVPFASIPSVQPTTFVIIMAGAVFGAESGFVVGALAAIVSNIFLGQGPWTPWQMYAWGMVGFAAGLLKNTWVMKSSVGRSIFGFITGFLFGWFMNLWVVLTLMNSFNWAQFIGFYTASFYFDLAHALSNVFFLLVFSQSWLKILKRFQKKYGLLTAYG
ncbi:MULTISPECIES: ECF transporter S component [Bacillaceae]|jgi:energy-coupling factor transport system substrate-specific component|uniref:ECF transporter S component n=2 Tax=Bacillaceae TaxID=186817 RepID=A0A090IYR1_9BACI|nr:hypothetical protein B4064_2822 [Caldibacillus thermoamylovorans]KIO66236.1 hypothetical protein B4166_2641 [Caldibacillus thermoamylovorans]KIO73709.1 hypothetical protein B4167_1952 [Caldibacillus thermoamylovorans]NWN97195.1 ECF transporter S component [Bacillus sp. (in: firmicutes)]CEE03231.1 hypothetical protein BT1A1_3450 [Caldibacillus thermoamylovorans]